MRGHKKYSNYDVQIQLDKLVHHMLSGTWDALHYLSFLSFLFSDLFKLSFRIRH